MSEKWRGLHCPELSSQTATLNELIAGCSKALFPANSPEWLGLAWVRLGWVRRGWVCLVWIQLGFGLVGFGLVKVGLVGFDLVGFGLVGLDLVGFGSGWVWLGFDYCCRFVQLRVAETVKIKEAPIFRSIDGLLLNPSTHSNYKRVGSSLLRSRVEPSPPGVSGRVCSSVERGFGSEWRRSNPTQ